MLHEIKIPELGESISEATIVVWLHEDGARVDANEALLELETDKVTMELEAPHAGQLAIKVAAGETVAVGEVVGTLNSAEAAAVDLPAPSAPPPAAPAPPAQPAPPLSPPAGREQMKAKLDAPEVELSPAVRRLVTEHALAPESIAATGPGGRITKGDVLQHLEQATQPVAAPPAPPAPKPPPPSAPAPRASAGEGPRQTRTKMTRLRLRIAERMVQAKSEAAILTTFNEVDMSNVMAVRSKHKAAFEERHGVGLGFMSFFVKAAVDALMTVPKLNAQIDGDEIVQNQFYDIGVAVGTDHGLLVPVVRDCDKLSFAGVEGAIADYARRARERTIGLEDLAGGCFTISNGGVYGSLLSTPILNPPQSGILGLHGIKKRPVVVDDEIVIRPMMYLAMSYDHRIVDGKEAVTFLKRIVECIENPERMMLKV